MLLYEKNYSKKLGLKELEVMSCIKNKTAAVAILDFVRSKIMHAGCEVCVRTGPCKTLC
jgi:hypothetical protein